MAKEKEAIYVGTQHQHKLLYRAVAEDGTIGIMYRNASEEIFIPLDKLMEDICVGPKLKYHQ